MVTDNITILDTTLRDGRQFLKADLRIDDRIKIVQALDRLGVSVIEAGFVSIKGDEEIIRKISEAVENAIVCAIAKPRKGEIEKAALALQGATRRRIHVFNPTNLGASKKDLGDYQSDLDESQTLESIQASVSFARKFSDDVEWTALDATRSENDFLFKAVETAIRAGASTVSIPDTTGIKMPHEFGALISEMRETVPNIDRVILSVHCHNLLGLATANSLEAIRHGARQVECTINGIGATGGNTSLDGIVKALEVRQDLFSCHHTIHQDCLAKVTQLVAGFCGQ